MAVVESRFRVMASEGHLILVDPTPGAAEWAERQLVRLESRWSRFLPDSDISRFNNSSDCWLSVAGDTLTLVETMQLAASITNGAYDPTLVQEILDAGYRSSIVDESRRCVTIDLPSLDLGVADVTVQRRSGSVFCPAGLALDPGGIGKGLAADLVVKALLESGTAGALVCIGGDLAAGGEPPTSDGWYIAVEDPHETAREHCVVALDGGGVATSSTLSRRWLHNGIARHHILDPASRGCSVTDLSSVTVIASAGWLAEAHSTAAVLAGSLAVVSYLESRGLTGIATTHDGRTLSAGTLRDSLSPSRAHSGVTA